MTRPAKLVQGKLEVATGVTRPAKLVQGKLEVATGAAVGKAVKRPVHLLQ